MSAANTTISELFQHDGDAIGGIDQPPLSYQALRQLAEETQQSFNNHGISTNDRVAIVLPNGPAMAASFICAACSATAAPLNPAYREPEFDFYLSDLTAKAIILERGSESPARDVAAKHGIQIIELLSAPDSPAGQFTLEFSDARSDAVSRGVRSSDIAMVLHTSGTTSRPKIVPLSHSNLRASAKNISRTLSLSERDHCLNIMPLFHIHGLIAAVLATLASGGQVTCTPGFNAMKFFGWLSTVAPSWYTAVPTMHQAILQRAARNSEAIENTPLRFIRSSSSSLAPQIMKELEQAFSCPVIESYGMTEATHQMASNPLPPAQRRAGSVGLAAGPEIRLADPQGSFLAQGAEGEIVIRGANVFSGYENNVEANAAAFIADPEDGAPWFRTGDIGVVDADAYLRIVGRVKEIINRGGEKVAPSEVDAVLIEHDAVAQVVTFAVPHAKLGEDVAAAAVLVAGQSVTVEELKDFASAQLARFKVPKQIIFLDEIPKGSTGKVQRIGLAKKLGLD